MTLVEHDSGLWVPNDSLAEVVKPGEEANIVVDNRTDLPDQEIVSYFEENSGMFGWSPSSRVSAYGGGTGSMLTRSRWTPPANVIQEIKLARDLAERDDDVAPAMEAMIAAALSDGFSNQHEDQELVHIFDRMTEDIDLQGRFAELYREWLIAGQINVAAVFTPATYTIRPEGVARNMSRRVAKPLMGVLPAENIRVIGDDLFGQARLAYAPDGELAMWLREFFATSTSAAKKNELRTQNPVRAAMFIGPVPIRDTFNEDLIGAGELFYLNPSIVQRTTMPKGAWDYPRPLLTRNLPLLEAKRLLNVMDHALLQGGTNYIVIAKKGSEKQPARQEEITNLREVVRRASKSGVLIGDHRVSLEIVTPDLTALLNPEKRQMIGRKLSSALLRVPEFAADETGQSVATFTELVQRVVTADRRAIVTHVHRHVWTSTMKRNDATFKGAERPDIWFPRIILTGLQFWTDYLLKMYDRGDLPRKYMVEFGGFNYDSVRAQKEHEIKEGHDDIFQPPAVPFSSPANGPGTGPQDNGGGRPPGSGPNNGAPGATPSTGPSLARPKRLIKRTRGEVVKAYYDEGLDEVVRIGEITDKILSEYPEAEIGRMTAVEQAAIDAGEVRQEGPVTVIPVNLGVEVENPRVVRLGDGLSLVAGNRAMDGAIIAIAICAREPHYTRVLTEDLAIRWGFEIVYAAAPEPVLELPPGE